MNSIHRILTLVAKEFSMVMRDPKSRVVVIMPPIVQFFIFGYAATFDLTNVRYATLDEAQSTESRALLAEFAGTPTFQHVQTLFSEQEIAPTIDGQVAALVIHIPEDFSECLTRGKPAQVQVIVDGRNSNAGSIALSYVGSIINRFGSKLRIQQHNQVTAPAIELVTRSWFNENLVSRWFIVAPLGGVISMVITLILTSLSVAREREFGTFDQLLVAPFRPFEILIGKALPPIIFGFVDALILCIAASWWFGIPFRGSPLALCLSLLVFVIALSGVGLFISSICSTMQQALLGSMVVMMPSVVLSGFTTPIANMPDWLQPVTYLIPLRYVVQALREIFLIGADVPAVLNQLIPMGLIALATLPAAAFMFRHKTT